MVSIQDLLANGRFYHFGCWVYRRRWMVIGVWVVVLAASAVLAPRVGSVLKGGFGDQDTEAHIGLDLLESEGILPPTILVIVFNSPDLTTDDPRFQSQVQAALDGLSGFPGLERFLTPYETSTRRLISHDGHTAYALAFFHIPLDDALDLVPDIRARIPPLSIKVWVTGAAAIFSDINDVTQKDLQRAEVITFPVVAVALLLIFGTLVSVAAPVAIGAFGLGLTMATVYLLGLVTDMSVFALNTATLLGVGAAIDYSLLMVSRFREEMESRPIEESIGVTMATAGKAILFSSATTILGLMGLLIFELSMLRTIGIGGIVVICASMIVALTLLPALLCVLGRRVDALPVLPSGLLRRNLFWRNLANWVMKHPFLVMVPLLVFLLLLGAPFLQGRLGIPWAGVLPPEAEARQGWDLVAEEFGEGEVSPVLVAFSSEKGALAPETLAAIYDYSRAAAAVRGVTRVESIVDLRPDITKEEYLLLYSNPAARELPGVADALKEFGGDKTTMLRVYIEYDINSDEARGVVKDLRALAPDAEVSIYVTGATASLMDAVDAMYSTFPWALVLVMASEYLVLLVLFRSVVIPLKAIVMNGMSIFASYGALVFIFQQGHFEKLLNFTSNGFLEATLPILLFMILFGLSMDYEIFLLVRIKEIYDTTGDNRASVALGLEKTGRIITSAALVLVLVSGSFAFGDIIIIKALGLGIAIAIFLDSTLVRALLVPALMRVLGDLNWWAPEFMKKVGGPKQTAGGK